MHLDTRLSSPSAVDVLGEVVHQIQHEVTLGMSEFAVLQSRGGEKRVGGVSAIRVSE